MGQSALYSALLHVAIILLVVFGVPDWLRPEPPIIERTVVVEIVDPSFLKTVQIARVTNLPQRVEKPVEVKKPEPKPEVKPPPTPPLPEPLRPEPRPNLKPEPKTEPPPQPEAKDRKESKPDSFDALLRNVGKLAKTEKREKAEKEDRKAKPTRNASDSNPLTKDFEKTIAGLVGAGSTQHVPDLPLSLSEIDAIRAQIERCWNVPAGARDAGNLIVEIRVQFAPNGQVLSAQIVEDARYQNDRFYRAAADSAKRAVHQCSPIKAPPTKYERWREVRLRFNPQAMLGL